MTDKMHANVFLAMGLGSLGLTWYATSQALSLPVNAHYGASLTLCVSLAVFFVFLAALHFYTAYAFRFGILDEVLGSRDAAMLRRSGHTLRAGVRIQCINTLGIDDLSLTDDRRRVLFVSGWLPWVCPLSKFNCDAR